MAIPAFWSSRGSPPAPLGASENSPPPPALAGRPANAAEVPGASSTGSPPSAPRSKTSSNPRNLRLDVIRGIAITWVFAHHFSNGVEVQIERALAALPSLFAEILHLLLGVLHTSRFGVAIFWTISGFCIHLSFLRWRKANPGPVGYSNYWRSFFTRRFLRIYPAYLVALVGCYLLTYQETAFDWESLRKGAVHLLMMQNLSQPHYYNINYSFWSIAVESQRYALYPLYIVLYLRLGFPRAALITIGSSLALQVFGSDLTRNYLVIRSPVYFWLDWLIGVCLAESFFRGKHVFSRPRWMLALLALAVICAFNSPVYNWLRIVLRTAFVAVLIETLLHNKRPLSFLERCFLPAGVFSYSMFLIHLPVVYTLLAAGAWYWNWNYFGEPATLVIGFLLFYLATLAICGIFYWAVESRLVEGFRFTQARRAENVKTPTPKLNFES